MARREIIVEARIRWTQLTTRIIVPKDLAEILVRNDESLEEEKKPGYVQARKSFIKETGRDPGWLSIENCDFRVVGKAPWADKTKEKPKKPLQRQLFRPKNENLDKGKPIQQKLF